MITHRWKRRTEMKAARCEDCPALLCYLNVSEPSPAFCPSTRYMKEIRKATHELIEGDLGEAAKISSVVEGVNHDKRTGSPGTAPRNPSTWPNPTTVASRPPGTDREDGLHPFMLCITEEKPNIFTLSRAVLASVLRASCLVLHGYVRLYIAYAYIDGGTVFLVDRNNCSGCGVCEGACTCEAIRIEEGIAVIDQATCNQCGSCFTACPQGAIYQDETTATPAFHQPARTTALSKTLQGDVARVATERRSPRLIAAFVPAVLEAAAGLARSLIGERRSRILRGTSGGTVTRPSLAIQHRHRFRGGRK
ncbi:MAG: DUF362 domain-containing protein [Actinomycetota bacterium]